MTAVNLLPHHMNKKVRDLVVKACPACAFDMDDLTMSAFKPGRILARGVKFASSTSGVPVFEVEAEEVRVDLSLKALITGEVKISSVRIEKPQVVFRDAESGGDKKKRPPRERRKPKEFEVGGVEIRDGKFRYERLVKGTHAKLNIHKIDVDGERFGTTPELIEKPIEARAQLQIEKSGDIELRVKTNPWAKPLKVSVDIHVKNQNLDDLTPFFKENAGVSLQGTMLEGRGKAEMNGDKLGCYVWAEYKDFDLKLSQMHDRDPVTAFFMSLGSAVVMNEKNLEKHKTDQTRGVNTTREEGEPIVGFILRGLKEAAIKVSKAE